MACAMARKRRFRFGLPIVFVGRPSFGGGGLGCQFIRFAGAARFGSLGGRLPDSLLSESKSPQRIIRRGPNSCDDEEVPVICPTCQIISTRRLQSARSGEMTTARQCLSIPSVIRAETVPGRRIAIKQLVGCNSAAYCAVNGTMVLEQ